MFFKTYKTTFKRIFRSPLFWMVLAIVAVIVFLDAHRGSYGGSNYSMTLVKVEEGQAAPTGEVIVTEDGEMYEKVVIYDSHDGDRDSRFRLGYHKYHEVMGHRLRFMMFYALPCLAVVIVMIVVGGDYKDNFYEIERAGGVRASSYFFGRLCAIATLLFALSFALSLFSFNYYFFTRGGLASLSSTPYPDLTVIEYPFKTLGGYLFDSTKTILRLVLLCQMPALLLFATFTYMVGSYFESGLVAGIGGNGTVILAYLALGRYQWQYETFVNKYLLPAKNGPYLYLSRFDTAFNSPEYVVDKYAGIVGLNKNGYLSDTPEGVVGWIATMLLLSAVFITVSYICTRRRRI
ncbi:MAG: hypothetical protein IKM46_03285 [Clostridia bacterium]|nr:hypothetical protein [Clostridia bacterium]